MIQIKNPQKRKEILQTMMSSPEHLESIKLAGLYGHLIHYIQVVQNGGQAPLLPGERQNQNVNGNVNVMVASSQMTEYRSNQIQKNSEANQKGNEKAMNYFSACLRILGLMEEVALTPELLKSAYKKAVVKAHPDKGGSEKEFEAVTKAYAYLGEILQRINGGRSTEGKVEAPNSLASSRQNEAEKWKHVEPVRLNPEKLDINRFNKMFEETKMPDPEDMGYGDWLKGSGDSIESGPKFSGKFNRDVFNRAFDDIASKGAKGGQQNSLVVQEMSLASRIGYATELGRGAREDFTVAPHEGKFAFTDLKKAYTEYNTFSQETAGVKVENRTMEGVSKERKEAPRPLTDYERQALYEAEQRAMKAEELRKMRMAQQSIEEDNYFERMKRLVIRN
jgi:curved DNA-binding protein CbpA